MREPYGAFVPGWLDRKVIALTSRLPDNWLGLRLAIGLRRIVTARLAGDDALDVMLWGLRLRLHPRRNGCEKGALFTPQMFEAAERTQLYADIDGAKAAGRPFMFVDVGANVGLFSFLVAARAGAHASILAIEPEPENLRRLRFNIANNPGLGIQVVPIALGETEGHVALDIDPHDRGGTRTRDAGQTPENDAVVCRPLLSVVGQYGISMIDALKIDVEGAEDRILVPFFRDAPQRLWPKLLIVEDAGAVWRTDLSAFLSERGYFLSARSKLNLMMRRNPEARSVAA